MITQGYPNTIKWKMQESLPQRNLYTRANIPTFQKMGSFAKNLKRNGHRFQRLPQEFRIIDNCETEGHFMVLCYGKILLVQSVLL